MKDHKSGPSPGTSVGLADKGDDKHEHHASGSRYVEVGASLLCGALLLLGWWMDDETSATFTTGRWLLVGAYLTGGWFTAKEAWENLRARRLQIDMLMLVAAAGAAALGEWAEGALLLFLFSLGHALENFALGRARRAIEALAALRPETALVRKDGTLTEVPVETLVPGDIVVVKPDERLAADGFVIVGETSIDQAAITGESVPVDKRPVPDQTKARASATTLAEESRVYAGTINRGKAIEIEVTRRSDQSTLARVVELVRSAESSRSPTQLFTDRFQRIFVPSVLVLATLLLFAWVVVDEPFSASFYRAMAVLVAASPCALAISTPSAVLSGVARAARGGVLVKGGEALERLGVLHAIAFDKTGTLTEGKPRLTDIRPAQGVTQQQLLRVAVSVERLSDHPLAAAVVRDGASILDESDVPEAKDLESLTGKGLKAVFEGEPVLLGKRALFTDGEGADIPLPDQLVWETRELERSGRTVFIVRMGSRYLGAVGLMDTPRETASKVVRQLRALGMTRLIMLSGDNQRVADNVATTIGLDGAHGDLMPEDKVEAVRRLRESGEVAMVGDGVNDAPAMASASVGIAMGAAGSDVALETAGVALMSDRLEQLPFAVELSRKSRRIIRQNLWASLGMVAFLIPATIFGLQMGFAVLFHEGSTLLVVANALRLLAFQPSNTS